MKRKSPSPKKEWIMKELSFHVIHQCRTEARLLSFDNGRKNCQERLRQAALKSRGRVLNYIVAPDHLQVIISGSSDQVTEIIRYATSATASDYAQRTSRKKPFWEGRYNAVLVQNGVHLLRSSLLMDRVMTDREVCLYPGEWRFSGYQEITGIKKRYRFVDVAKAAELTGFDNEERFRQWYINDSEGERFIAGANRALMSRALALGDQKALESIGECFSRRTRKRIEVVIPDDKNPTYGIFIADKVKRAFTRSIKNPR